MVGPVLTTAIRNVLLVVVASLPQADSFDAPVLPVGVLGEEVRLDGRLDEPAWNQADAIGNLTMIEPVEGIDPTLRTIVKVLAGERDLIIGIICTDDDPAGIVSYSKARDSELRREDHIRIVLDTFRDGRSGYVFAINPSGARYDALISGRGEGENRNWDEVWEAHTEITDQGWSAEIRIPLRSLRFDASLDAWGFNIERRVERLQEISRWSGARRDWALTQTSRAGTITGLPDFQSGIGLSVRPAVVGSTGKPVLERSAETEGDVSLDVTQLIGSGLLGSLTVNTDFAETEVDARRTNLTRFPLFFPEKRSFFLEGADIFEFGLGLGNDVVPFFSRRIGLVHGREVPLEYGGKLNGRVSGTNLGALAVHTGDVDELVPSTGLGVVRVQQNVFAESSIGMIGTAGDPLGRTGAWTTGVDFTYQTSSLRGNKNFLVGVWAMAVDRDDLTEGDKSAVGFKIDYPNDTWDWAVTYHRIGEAFDPSLGFVPRRGVQIFIPKVDYLYRPSWTWMRNTVYEFRVRVVTDLGGEWESYRVFTAPVNWRFESGDRFEFNVVPEGERLEYPFEIADGVVIPPGTYHWQRYRFEGDFAPKRQVSGRVSWWFGSFYDGTLDQIQLSLRWNPSATLNLAFGGEHNVGDLPFGAFTQDLVSTRVAVNFSPDLQVTSFLQYDNESDSFGSNTRLRWTYSPLGDLFVIYNYNIVELADRIDPMTRWTTDTNQLKVKLQYTVRR